VLAVNDLYFGERGNDTILGSRVGTDWIFCARQRRRRGDDGNILAAHSSISSLAAMATTPSRGRRLMRFGEDGDDIIQAAMVCSTFWSRRRDGPDRWRQRGRPALRHGKMTTSLTAGTALMRALARG
jgi:hypothetical protein